MRFRRSFLEKKGLSAEEIDEAFRRCPVSGWHGTQPGGKGDTLHVIRLTNCVACTLHHSGSVQRVMEPKAPLVSLSSSVDLTQPQALRHLMRAVDCYENDSFPRHCLQRCGFEPQADGMFPSFSFQDASTGSESVEISASSKDAIPGSTLKHAHASAPTTSGTMPAGGVGNQQATSVPPAGAQAVPVPVPMAPAGGAAVGVARTAAMGRPAMPAWQRAAVAVALLAGGGAASVALSNVRRWMSWNETGHD